jgi:ABC-type polar amino acid transport system ATPase subunit
VNGKDRLRGAPSFLNSERLIEPVVATHSRTDFIPDRSLLPAMRIPGLFMDAGVIIEEGTPERVFGSLEHARTRVFLRKLL